MKQEGIMEFAEKFKNAVKDNFNASVTNYSTLEGSTGIFTSLSEALSAELRLTAEEKRQIKTILDVGCGYGNSTNSLSGIFENSSVVGLDLSDQMIAAAETGFPKLDFICGDGETIDQYFPPKLFDLIVYSASLFIMPDQEKALDAASQVLRDGGTAAASILRGLREKNGRQADQLPPFKGIVKNEKLIELFKARFGEVTVSNLSIDLDPSLLRLVYNVEALAAGAFPGKTAEERASQLSLLIKEVEEKNLEIVQDWALVVGKNKIAVI
jgi:ubiquinone/menaquinone biosynthesis C-methylase UbiE